MFNRFSLITCTLFALSVLGQSPTFAQGNVSYRIENNLDAPIVVTKIVMNRAARTFDVVEVTTIGKNKTDGKVTVEDGADLEFYLGSYNKNQPDKNVQIGHSVKAKENGKAVFRKPGFTVNFDEAYLEDINYSEQGWEIETMFTIDAKLQIPGKVDDSKQKVFGSGSNLEVAYQNSKNNFWSHTFNMTDAELSKAVITLTLSNAAEEDPGVQVDDPMLVHNGSKWGKSGSVVHKNMDVKTQTGTFYLQEGEMDGNEADLDTTRLRIKYSVKKVLSFEAF